MTDDTFKLPGSSYDELCRIIQGYGKLNKPSPLDDISQIVKMNPTVISRNNAFLIATGIIDAGRLKSPTERGRKLARAIDYDHHNEIAAAWREIVASNEFMSKMLAAIRIRRTMDTSTFQSHIAYSAGQNKSITTMAGAKAILEILINADLITEKDGQLIPTAISFEQEEQISIEQDSQSQNKQPQEIPGGDMEAHSSRSRSSSTNVSIQIRLDVKPDEIDGLGLKIRKLLDEISEELKNK